MNRILLSLLVVSALCLTGADGQSRAFTLSSGDGEGWLGVSIEDVTSKLADRENLKTRSGAFVTSVEEDSPAEIAGIREGDVIVRVGSKEIDDSEDLVRAVRRSEPGEEVTVVVERGGESRTLTAKLEETRTPRAFTMTIPRTPHTPKIAPMPRAFGMGFFRSGEELGMEMQDLNRQLAEYFEVPGNRGVLVSSVDKKGAAADAGLKAGDVIVKVDGNTVRDIDDVLDELREADTDTVPIEVVRRGKPMTFKLDAGEYRDDISSRDMEWEFDHDAQRMERFEGLRDLKESLMKLREELKMNAVHLREALKEGLRDL